MLFMATCHVFGRRARRPSRVHACLRIYSIRLRLAERALCALSSLVVLNVLLLLVSICSACFEVIYLD